MGKPGAGGGAVNVRGFQPDVCGRCQVRGRETGKDGRNESSDLVSETTKAGNVALRVMSFSIRPS